MNDLRVPVRSCSNTGSTYCLRNAPIGVERWDDDADTGHHEDRLACITCVSKLPAIAVDLVRPEELRRGSTAEELEVSPHGPQPNPVTSYTIESNRAKRNVVEVVEEDARIYVGSRESQILHCVDSSDPIACLAPSVSCEKFMPLTSS